MAQIIKHRRGSIDSLVSATAKKGELVMATGSVGNLQGPWIFVGETEGSAGAFRTLSKIYQGSNAPDLTVGTWGSTLNGTPFYGSTDQKLYILSNAGNITMDLTGNIEGNTINNVTINNLTGTTANLTAVSSSFFTGSFIGDGSQIYNIPASGVTGLQLDRITSGNATASIDETNGLRINKKTEITGSLIVSGASYIYDNVYITGNTYQTGSIYLTGDVTLRGNINIGDSLTGDTVNINGEISSSLIPAENNTFDLGSSTNAWRDLYVSGTAYIESLALQGISVNSISLPGDLVVSGTTTLSGSVFIEDNTTVNGNLDVTGSLDVTGDTTFNGNVTITGLTENRVVIVGANGILEDDTNFTFDGTTLKVGASFEIDEQDGDIRTSGSAIIDSTIEVNGQATLSSANVEDLTSGRIVLAGASGELEDSSDFTFDGTTFKIGNGQFEVDVADGDVRTSGSFTIGNGITVNGDLNVTEDLTVTGKTIMYGDLYVSGNVEFLASASYIHISSSIIELDDNIIRLNAYSPFERYAGFEVIDSGSSNTSASLVWDSLNDYWMFVSSSGQSSKLIGTTTNSYGSEISLTQTYIPIATGPNTIGDSLLRYSGTTLSFNTNKFTIDSGTGDTTISGGLTLSFSGGTDNGNNTSAIVFKNSNNLIGYVSTTETTDVLDGLLGYKNSDGALVFSTVVDGGTY